jgi:hypothetical protein
MIERSAVVGRVLLLILILFVFLSSTQAQIQPDASSQVSVIRSGLVFNRATNTYDSIATIINISSTDILAPLSLVLTINPSTVTLANASGAAAGGKPFVDIPVSGGILSAGTAVSNIVLKFHNPDRVAFSVTTQVLGPLIGPVSSPVVGVVVGSSIQAISPKVAAAGSGPIAIVITGSGLEGVTGVNITPSQGLSLEAFSVSSDGNSVTVPITVAADAAPTVRMISLSGTTGPYLPAAPDADRIQIVLAPL